MSAPTPEKLAASAASQLRETLAELTTTRARLAAVTDEREQAVRELAEQKRVNTSNLRTMTGQLDQARQMLADTQKQIAEMKLDESLREEGECWEGL